MPPAPPGRTRRVFRHTTSRSGWALVAVPPYGTLDGFPERYRLGAELPLKPGGNLSIGRSRAYEMVKPGEIPSLKLSPRRTRVRIQDLEQWVISKRGDGGKEEK